MVVVEMADLYARLEVGVPLGTQPDIPIPPIPPIPALPPLPPPIPSQMKAQK